METKCWITCAICEKKIAKNKASKLQDSYHCWSCMISRVLKHYNDKVVCGK